MTEPTHPAAGACPRMPESGGSYLVENGVRRQVEAPTRDHPEGNRPRPAPPEPAPRPRPKLIPPLPTDTKGVAK